RRSELITPRQIDEGWMIRIARDMRRQIARRGDYGQGELLRRESSDAVARLDRELHRRTDVARLRRPPQQPRLSWACAELRPRRTIRNPVHQRVAIRIYGAHLISPRQAHFADPRRLGDDYRRAICTDRIDRKPVE